MAWRFKSNLPLSSQIVERLRCDIISGIYELGSPFPTVRSLAEEAAVNPNTMQKALCLLEDEGLLVCQSTAGRSVTDDPDVIERARERATDMSIKALIDEAKRIGISRDLLIKKIKEDWCDGE